jgi:hypothetical protein
VIIIPVTNPDGYYSREDKLNANEVNLNLNFDTTDWQPYGPDTGQSAGREPFSEPESQVIRDIVDAYKPSTFISYHAKGAFVSPEENQESIDLSNWYISKTGYAPADASYDYPGTATKWYVNEIDGGAAITVELSEWYNTDWTQNKSALLEIIE